MKRVNDSLLLWRRRLGWIKYIPSKRSKFEVKIYKLCESSTGYVWNFIVYTGKDSIYGQTHPGEDFFEDCAEGSPGPT